MPRNKALSSKIYVLDTNILLHEPLAFLSFKENDVVVPMTVLEELDSIKGSKKNGSKKNVAKDARVSIRAMDVLDLGYERLMGRREWGVTPKNIINNLSFTGQINISSNLTLGECYV
jgi:PhoH-like ATPase